MPHSQPAFTVSQLARWDRVPNRQQEVDFRCACIFCKQPNRVRFGPQQVVLEQEQCAHYWSHEFVIGEGTVRFTFAR